MHKIYEIRCPCQASDPLIIANSARRLEPRGGAKLSTCKGQAQRLPAMAGGHHPPEQNGAAYTGPLCAQCSLLLERICKLTTCCTLPGCVTAL